MLGWRRDNLTKDCPRNNFPTSFPGSAWERRILQALPAEPRTRIPDQTRGRASRVVRSQAEPGTEKSGSYFGGVPKFKFRTFRRENRQEKRRLPGRVMASCMVTNPNKIPGKEADP